MATPHLSNQQDALITKLCVTGPITDREEVYDLINLVHEGERSVVRLVRANGRAILDVAQAAIAQNPKDCRGLTTFIVCSRARTGFVKATLQYQTNSEVRLAVFAAPFVQAALVAPSPEGNEDDQRLTDPQILAPFGLTGRKSKGLTPPMERQLATAAQEGHRALEQLLLTNSRLTLKVSKKFGSKTPLWDRFSEGRIGLISAIQKFETQRGLALSTYATHWIRHGVDRARDNQEHLIRIPVHAADRLRRFKRIIAKLPDDASESEIATATEMTVEEVRNLLQLGLSTTSMDKERAHSRDLVSTLHDRLPTPESTAEEKCYLSERRTVIQQALATLSEKERQIVSRRFFGKQETLEQIGDDPKFGLSRERIRQLQARALEKIRPLLGDFQEDI